MSILNIQGFVDSLSIMASGMGGIFAVVLVIFLLIVLMNKVFPDK